MIKQFFIPGGTAASGNGGSNNNFWFMLLVLAGVTGVCIYLAKSKPYTPALKETEAKNDNNKLPNPPKTEVQNG